LTFGDEIVLKTPESLESQLKSQIVLAIGSNTEEENFTAEGEQNLETEFSQESMAAFLKAKFPDREHDDNTKLASLLLRDLKSEGIKNYGQLEKIIDDNMKLFDSFEKENPPSNTSKHRFSDIGVIRIILSEYLMKQ
jgi:hypothetical protein